MLAKRQDGTTILLNINPMEGLAELLERIARHEVNISVLIVDGPCTCKADIGGLNDFMHASCNIVE